MRRLVKQRDRAAKASYIKVVELQRRGVPHFHAVIRLDESSMRPTDLAALVHQSAASVRLDVPGLGGELVTLRFGTQTDVQPLQVAHDDDSDRRVASYLAKYVTKSVDDFGLSPRRISPLAVGSLDLRPHVRQILWTVLALADSPGPPDMARWLHSLGYRGHITTKTRAYSTTMGALRARRAEWRTENSGADLTAVHDDVAWEFVTGGHATAGERLLVATAAASALEARRVAREELVCGRADHDH